MLGILLRLIKKKSDSTSTGSRLSFGRYSDNNKTVAKSSRWAEADELFKKKKYIESVTTFFDYLKDDREKNVEFSGDGKTFDFTFFQGSKVIRGRLEKDVLTAEVRLAKMPQPSIPVMRRLLEMNFELYYSRYALHNDDLCMRFDTHLETANPSKLYYGFKELAVKSDKQDDLLVQEFSILQPVDEDHIVQISEKEKAVKYDAMQSWIRETLDKTETTDADKFSGGIPYLLLALVYRIDFLIAPQGRLMNDLEKISEIYFKKDESPREEKIRNMIEMFKKLLESPKEDICKYFFRSKYTFSIVVAQPHKTIAGFIQEACNNMKPYKDKNEAYFANKILEYGLTYCQYSYSLPQPLTQLIEIFMRVNYPQYFASLGGDQVLYKPAANRFEQDMIIGRIKKIEDEWKEKYPLLRVQTDQLSFADLLKFNYSFAKQIEQLTIDEPA